MYAELKPGAGDPAYDSGDKQAQLRLQLAALLVLKAISGQPHDTQVSLPAASSEPCLHFRIQAYAWRHKLRFVRRAALAALIALTFLTKPRWCCSAEGPRCDDPRYFVFGLPYLDAGQALAVECAALAALVGDLALWAGILTWPSIRGDSARIGHILSFAVMVLELILRAVGATTPCSWRVAPYIRIYLPMLYNPRWLAEQRTFTLGTTELLKLILLMEGFVVVAAWFAILFFANTGLRGNLFDNYGDAFWNLQVLLTTNNFPDVMMQQYTAVRASGMFFVGFIVIGLFLLLQMVIAFVSDAYMNHRRERVQVEAEHKRTLLDEAFYALDTEGNGFISREQLFRLLDLLDSSGMIPTQCHERHEIIFAVLDEGGTNNLDREEFAGLSQSLKMHFSKVADPWLKGAAPDLWARLRGEDLRRLLQSKSWELFMLAVLCVYAALSIRLSWPLLSGTGRKMLDSYMVRAADFSLASAYAAEALAKALFLGWQEYVGSWNCLFEAFSTAFMCVACAVMVMPNDYGHRQVMQTTNILGLVRIFRLAATIPCFTNILRALQGVGRGISHVLPGLLTRFLLFDLLGCDLFGGLVTTDESSPAAAPLGATVFGTSGYHALNFNDHFGGAMMLFACLVMNNWNTYTDAIVAGFGPLARIYFVVWWVAGVLAGLNLVIGVALSAVIKEMGALEEHGEEDAAGPAAATFDAGMITGTRTSVQGTYRVTIDDEAAGEADGKDPMDTTTSSKRELLRVYTQKQSIPRTPPPRPPASTT